ncbi:hypothetical protein GCM10009868_01840 [Terrabacter aerolatus]|uniref:Uncharacterized protein n=1 Tax=Terrabacter aerolatus TaxID=422442 RepID=A0A512D2K9_9MICO|nr:hypothetical protein TAE01_25090 [Terrabacter aerolatus]
MIWSVNVVPYLCWHGLPVTSDAETVAQPKNELTKTPSSLPPMVMVTRRVSLVTASSCGATPGACEEKKSDVLAPLHVTSVNDDGFVIAAMSWAKFSADRLHVGGAVATNGATPAAEE